MRYVTVIDKRNFRYDQRNKAVVYIMRSLFLVFFIIAVGFSIACAKKYSMFNICCCPELTNLFR